MVTPIRACPPGSDKSFAEHYTKSGVWPCPWPNEDPRYPPIHLLSREKNAAARASGQQIPKIGV